MTKEEFIDKVKTLPGVGPKTAEKLYDAGFKTVEDLKAASVEDLTKDNLVGKRTAEAILEGLKDLEGGDSAQAIEVREEQSKAERRATKDKEKVVVKEPEQVYPKVKAQLPEELVTALAERADAMSRQPEFKRFHWYYKRSLERNPAWRAPRGTLNKQRRGFIRRPPRVKVGYGKPKVTRGLHASGFREVMVHNLDDLEKITDPKTEAARIGRTVGGRKRKLIQAKAAELAIRVLNPRRT